MSTNGDSDGGSSTETSQSWWRRFGILLHGGDTTAEDLAELDDKLLFSGRADIKDRLVRFFVMLSLSAVIASGGVVGDSTAVVIGAMIIAPLMTPILASALCIATGRGKRLWRQVGVVATGVGVVIGIAILMAVFSITPLELTTNSQVLSRVSPNTLDLIIALASGLAGSFAVTRREVGDALPGVAISISLVPPLCVTGLSMAEGEWGFAAGSFLLFLTNFTAILVAGSAVFLLLGFGGIAVEEFHEADRRRGLRLVWFSMGVIAILLGAATYGVVVTQQLQHEVNASVDDWLAQHNRGTPLDTEWGKYEVRVNAPTEASCAFFENCPTPEAVITVGGQGARPEVSELARIIEKDIGRELNMTVNYVSAARDRTTVNSES